MHCITVHAINAFIAHDDTHGKEHGHNPITHEHSHDPDLHQRHGHQ